MVVEVDAARALMYECPVSPMLEEQSGKQTEQSGRDKLSNEPYHS